MVTRGSHNKSLKSGKYAAGLAPRSKSTMYKIIPANGNPVVYVSLTPFQLEQWNSGTMPTSIAQHVSCSFYDESSGDFHKIALSRATKEFNLLGLPAVIDEG